jgi:hypothetical protein
MRPPAQDDAPMLRAVLLLVALPLAACGNVRYDLAGVPFPVMATASPSPFGAPGAPAGVPFEVKQKYILWGYGLFGESQPDVAGALRSVGSLRTFEQLFAGDDRPTAAITDFRVAASANLWDWLGTHLSLGLVRLRTVHVRGVRVPAAPTAK